MAQKGGLVREWTRERGSQNVSRNNCGTVGLMTDSGEGVRSEIGAEKWGNYDRKQ